MTDNLTSVYQDLADYIKAREGQCVLVLGPELSVNSEGISYRTCFRKLAADSNNGIFSYFEEDNLFSFNDQLALKNTRRLVKEFYRGSGDKALLKMIARIRFPLIINVCPDEALNNVYREAGIPFRQGYFSKDAKPKFADLPYPSKELPVIYNIFGTTDPDTTMILEHSKLYETIQYLLPDNSLPENIENYLSQVSGFILLGLRFDSWYYQLLCHKLKLREYNKSKTNLSASSYNNQNTVSVVMRKHFEIDFAPDNPMQAVARLIADCSSDPDALRAIDSPGNSSLFVSYAWKEKDAPPVNRETVVDWLEKYSGLTAIPSLQFFRDHNDLNFGDSINSFMTRIGKGKTVIRVISEKYLRSRYCMTEAMRIDQYRDDDKRVLTVVWPDANLADEKGYRDYWRSKSREIMEDPDNENFDDAVKIYRFLPAFFKKLKDEVNLQAAEGDFEMDADNNLKIVPGRQPAYSSFVALITDKLTAP